MSATSFANSCAPLIEVHRHPWAGACPADFPPDTWEKLATLWKLSVDEASAVLALTTSSRMCQAYWAYCIRLRKLVVSLSSDLRVAALQEHEDVQALREALVARTRIDRESRSETHRGPYVPGGAYTEYWLEPVLEEEEIAIDLADFSDDLLIPRRVEADVDDVQVAYTLDRVEERGPAHAHSPHAIYCARID